MSMKKTMPWITAILLLGIVGISIYRFVPYIGEEDYRDPKIYGCIPDAETAENVADAIWRPVIGKRLNLYKPFNVELKDSIWYIKGDLHADFGGVIRMEIGKSDC